MRITYHFPSWGPLLIPLAYPYLLFLLFSLIRPTHLFSLETFPVLNRFVLFPSPYLDMLKSTIFYNIPHLHILIIFPLTFLRPHSIKLPLLAWNSQSTDKVSDLHIMPSKARASDGGLLSWNIELLKQSMEKSLPWLLCFNFLYSNVEGAEPLKEGIVEWWLGR